MKDRLLLKDLVPGKPSTWNRHALSFVYDSNEDNNSVPVELVYPDDSVSIGCNAASSSNPHRTPEDNNEFLESIDSSTLVVFASKHHEFGRAFKSHKYLTTLIALYLIYTIALTISCFGMGFEIINGYSNLIFNFLTSISHLFCVGFMLKRIEMLFYIHTLLSNIMLCISSVYANNIPQIMATVLQTLICIQSFRAFEKESSHVFVTYNLQQ